MQELRFPTYRVETFLKGYPFVGFVGDVDRETNQETTKTENRVIRMEGLRNPTITATEDMGGEIAEFLKKHTGKTIRCFGFCKKERVMDEFMSYEHSGGMEDKDGKKWWIYFECPECQYGHSGHKMNFFMEKTEIERRSG